MCLARVPDSHGPGPALLLRGAQDKHRADTVEAMFEHHKKKMLRYPVASHDDGYMDTRGM